jgi:hypothetical protein
VIYQCLSARVELARRMFRVRTQPPSGVTALFPTGNAVLTSGHVAKVRGSATATRRAGRHGGLHKWSVGHRELNSYGFD